MSSINSKKSDKNDSDYLISKEAEFLYNSYLLLSLLPSFAIILIFGGRSSILALCFGSLTTYIFDLLGTMEGTLFCIFITLLSIWATLLYASRMLLFDSYLNISILLVHSIVLFYIFITIASYFRSIRNEFDSTFYFMEKLMFTTIPIISSVMITWFVCIEFPLSDISICFSTSYFFYLLYFGKPRMSSYRKLSDTKEKSLIISRIILNTMYIIPIIISPILHISLKINILKNINMTHIASFCTSFLCPMLYMNTCMEYQIVHYLTEDKLRLQLPTFGTIRLILSTLIFICVQGYSIFDDLKVFSNLHEPLASATVCATAVLILFCVYLQVSSTYSLGSNNSQSNHKIGITNGFFSTVLAITCCFIGILLNMSYFAIIIFIIWAISMAELYQRSWVSRNSTESIIWCILVLLSSSTGAFVAFQFTLKTIYHLNFEFIWQLNLSMQQLCYIFSILIAIAIIVPTLAFSKRQTYDIISTLLPHAFEENESDSNKSYAVNMFSLCFQGCAYLFTALELTIREQNWQSQGIMTSQVYPSYLLGSTTLLFYCTAIHLLFIERIGFTTVWIVFILQGCKLLNLVGMSLLGTTAISSMILSHTLPFFFHFENVKKELSQPSFTDPSVQNNNLRIASKASHFQILSYILSATGASYWFYKSIMHTILSTIMQRETSTVQDIGASMSFYFLFIAALLIVNRRYLLISTFIMMLALLSLLVAADALGPIKLSQNASRLTVEFKFFPDGNEDNGVYLIISFFLIALKILNVISIRKILSGLIFALVLSYTLSKGIIGFFPNSQSIFRHNDVHLLWIYSISSTFLGCLIVLIPKFSNPFILRCSFIMMEILPFITLSYVFYMGKVHEYNIPIIWIAIGINSLLSIITRVIDVIKEIHKQSHSEKEMYSSISMISAFSGIFWTAILSLTSYEVNSDIAIPLSFTLLMCIKQGLLFDNIPPITICSIFSSLWWFFSGFYSIFFKGYYEVNYSKSIAKDISIWTSPTLWYPILNFILLLLPMPSIILGYLNRSNDTEDIHFVLSIVSSLSIIGSQCMVIRLLGIVGLIYSSKRCYDIGKRNKKSRRII